MLKFLLTLFLAVLSFFKTSSVLALGTGSSPLEPKVIIVAGWENGEDTGDAPGEYQFWVERHHLDEKVPVKGIPKQILRRNKAGVYGLVLKDGIMDLTALALDSNFNLKRTYWIFTGISGIDPKIASIGSVAWARWVIDGDALREIDDRTVPKGWPYGLWAIGASRPNERPKDPNHYGSVIDIAELSKAYGLNLKLAHWAYAKSRHVKLVSLKQCKEELKNWKNYPNAAKPPRIMEGETLGALRYWHGKERTQWARDWVALWTQNKGSFVMTNEESQSNQRVMQTLAKFGYIDIDRVMVLRSGSNFCLPPAGVSANRSIGNESAGQIVAFDNNERAGAPVVLELTARWEKYKDRIPGS